LATDRQTWTYGQTDGHHQCMKPLRLNKMTLMRCSIWLGSIWLCGALWTFLCILCRLCICCCTLLQW